MHDNKFRVKIYGVRGSYPPLDGKGTEYGVNTTCLRIDIGKHIVIIDAGTGIIKLGFDLMNEMKAGDQKQNYHQLFLFFTHTHIDHLMGFPYFSPLYHPKTELNIITATQLNYSIEEILETLMSPAFFPVTIPELPSQFFYKEFAENKQVYFFNDDYEIITSTDSPSKDNWIGKISCMRNYTHPKGGVYIYKFEDSAGHSVIFATDVEGFVGTDQRLVKFSQNADVLIHDAQYTLPEYEIFQGFGHSTFEMACEVAAKASVGKLVLSHHDPKHSDAELKELETKAKNIFPETYIASETMEFTF
jgi:phosphoribosyl 1,2-cyclic phosphodiesterase